MTEAAETTGRDDPFDLHRFLIAQEDIYDQVVAELKSGRKRSHWMWFVFPQIDGLGYSTTTAYYAIKSVQEARQYLKHPVLGTRLAGCAELVLAIEGRSISAIFGYPDDLKLKSSMTLFEAVGGPRSVFSSVLEKYFDGERDDRTLRLLEKLRERMAEDNA
jgi:uncharacterized protein (DUF1810 family)